MFFRSAFLCVLACIFSLSAYAENPQLLLAKVYKGDIELSQYWVSEKLDGVRGYWDGKQLRTRQGHTISAPQWFVEALPHVALDGELWIGRERFDEVSAIIRRHQATEQDWRKVKYMLFDLPGHPGTFNERMVALKRLVAKIDRQWVQMIPQRKLADEEALMALLDQVVEQGGEGLMLHKGESRYRSGRRADLLKLKPWQDAEATVVAHLPGKGKYEGKLGALLVEMPGGMRFRLGSGFTDQQRADPPPLGSQVTYKYTGLTLRGVPRFASFLRVYRP